ncbi:MAG: ATP-binding protein [Proteobacteria bacterium]|nr:ATP-binding protein [Pseudomonadota bacterium]
MSAHYARYLKIELPAKQSAFLWGARKTGKSTYLKETFPQAVYYDFLHSEVLFKFLTTPHIFREEILALDPNQSGKLIIVDEVQKLPEILNEIHWLIENTDFQFILCGSSARKLRRLGSNLLGGRAWKYHFFPLIFPEITDFDLLRIFTHGTIPAHYHSANIRKALKAYIEDYLTLEIQAEGLVRNLPAFSRFLESIRFSHGELLNYTNMARDCGIDAKTVKEYFTILVDTLVGYYLYPYHKKVKRDLISHTPKFYLFDVGVANYIKQKNITDLKGIEAGQSLEHYIFLEITAYKTLKDKNFDITFWRTKTGYEVDFILGDAQVAIEVKIMDNIQKADTKGLQAFMQEHTATTNYIVSLVSRERKMTTANGDIHVLPVKTFLSRLWNDEII